jgi:uncharacterized OsmC-like protein
VDRVTQFTGFVIRARLRLTDSAHEEQARRVLARAEETCLITQSFKGATRLEAVVEVVAPERELAFTR